jgi:iron complex outermembrane receptor protein
MNKKNSGSIVDVWRRGSRIRVGAAAAALVFLVPACAKAMDYGSLEQLFNEPVTTSSTGTPQRASEVSADMTIITADQIRKSGSRTIPEILGMYIPGLNVLQEGIDAFDLGIRGYQQSYQPRLLVLVDGRQVFNDDYSRMSWDNMAVNIDDIRQIEVVKGAASALFGSNASGGVINIVTNSPTTDHDNSVSLSAGSQGQFHGDGTATIDLKGWGGIKLSVGGAWRQGIQDRAHRWRFNDRGGQSQPPLRRGKFGIHSQQQPIAANRSDLFGKEQPRSGLHQCDRPRQGGILFGTRWLGVAVALRHHKK